MANLSREKTVTFFAERVKELMSERKGIAESAGYSVLDTAGIKGTADNLSYYQTKMTAVDNEINVLSMVISNLNNNTDLLA